MNMVQKNQMKKNLEGMKQSTLQCIDALGYLFEHVDLTDEQREGLSGVIKHQENMVVFFTRMIERV